MKHIARYAKCILPAVFTLCSTATFAQESTDAKGNELAGTNIISFAPVQLTENGFGFGISHEIFMGNSGWVSLHTPLMITFNPSTEYSVNGNPSMAPMVYLQPGIKIYTNMNMPKRVKLSVGPNLVFGMGTGQTSYVYAGTTKADPTKQRSRFLLGAMATIGGNMFVSQNLYIGFDYSLGCSYLNNYDGINTKVIPLTQLGFRIGYRMNKHAQATQPSEKHQ